MRLCPRSYYVHCSPAYSDVGRPHLCYPSRAVFVCLFSFSFESWTLACSTLCWIWTTGILPMVGLYVPWSQDRYSTNSPTLNVLQTRHIQVGLFQSKLKLGLLSFLLPVIRVQIGCRKRSKLLQLFLFYWLVLLFYFCYP